MQLDLIILHRQEIQVIFPEISNFDQNILVTRDPQKIASNSETKNMHTKTVSIYGQERKWI